MTKRISIAMAIAVAIAVSTFAGGGPESTTTAAPAGAVDISVLNYLDLTGANSANTLKQTWGGFQKAYPEIIVTREDLYNAPYHEKLAAYAATGNLPDVMYVWPSGRSSSLYDNKLVKDLLPLVKRDGLDKVYAPWAIDPAGQYAGYVGEIPLTRTSSHIMMVNKKVLSDLGLKPATTYDELKAQVATLKAAGKQTIIMDNRDAWVMQSCLFSLVVGRFGGLDWDKQVLNGTMKFSDKWFVDSLAFIQDIYNSGVIDANISLASGYGDGLGSFANGQGAYFIDGDWRVGAFVTDISTGQALLPPTGKNAAGYGQDDIDIIVFPTIAGAKINDSTSSVLGTGWAIDGSLADGSPELEAAWTLVKYLTGAAQEEYGLSTGAYSVPSNTSVDWSKVTLQPLQKTLANIKYSNATAVIDGVLHADVYNVINTVLQEIGLGGQTPQQGAQAVAAAFDTWKAKQ